MFVVFVVVLIICVICGEIQNSILVTPNSRSHLFRYYEPGCYMESLDFVLAFNESYSPKDGQTCEQYKCDFDGYIYINRCTNTFEGNCFLVPGNKSLTYPDCCDYFICRKHGQKPASNIDDTIVQDSPNGHAENPEDLNNNSDMNQYFPPTTQSQNDVETNSKNPTENLAENVATDKNDISIETKTLQSVEAESSEDKQSKRIEVFSDTEAKSINEDGQKPASNTDDTIDKDSPNGHAENPEDLNNNSDMNQSSPPTTPSQNDVETVSKNPTENHAENSATDKNDISIETKTLKSVKAENSEDKQSKGIEEFSDTEAKSINEDGQKPASNTDDTVDQDSPNGHAENPEDLNNNSDMNQSSPPTTPSQNDVETVSKNPTKNHAQNGATDKNDITIETKTLQSIKAESSKDKQTNGIEEFSDTEAKSINEDAQKPASNIDDTTVQDSLNGHAENSEDLKNNSDMNQSFPTTTQSQNNVETVSKNPTENHAENVATDKNYISIETKTLQSVETENSEDKQSKKIEEFSDTEAKSINEDGQKPASNIDDTRVQDSPKGHAENSEDLNNNSDTNQTSPPTTQNQTDVETVSKNPTENHAENGATDKNDISIETKTLKSVEAESSKDKQTKGIEEFSDTEAKSINEDGQKPALNIDDTVDQDSPNGHAENPENLNNDSDINQSSPPTTPSQNDVETVSQSPTENHAENGATDKNDITIETITLQSVEAESSEDNQSKGIEESSDTEAKSIHEDTKE